MSHREDWPRDENADEDTDDIPVLTDVVVIRDTAHASHWDPDDLAGLKTALVAQVHDLAEGLVHEALLELEGVLLERITDRLKMELPELIERILHEHVESLGDSD